MGEITYRRLEGICDQDLYTAFMRAFKDYTVPIHFSPESFNLDNQRRGLDLKLSVGAFAEDELVGFVLNGKRMWEGKRTAYDMGTAVCKEYRGGGLTSRMLEMLNDILKEEAIEQYLLEVITTNEPACHLYLKNGFSVTREFVCLKGEKEKLSIRQKNRHPDSADSLDFDRAMAMWDVKPSWQNSAESVRAVMETLYISVAKEGGKEIGYGIIGKESGDLIQLAVDPAYRRRGVASSITGDLIAHTASPMISITNIDSTAGDVITFFKNLGFEERVGQYEMKKELSGAL